MDDRDITAVERIQVAAWGDLYDAAPVAFAAATGLSVRRIGGAVQLLLPAVPYRMFNRVLALGLDSPATDAELSGAIAAFDDAGCAARTISLSPVTRPVSLDNNLAALGWAIEDEWAALIRAPLPAAPAPTALRIERVSPGDAMAFGTTLARGYEAPDELAPWAAATVGRAGWTHFVAIDHETPVGCGALFIADDVAWFGMAATLPAARGHGAQSALFAARIDAAVAAGCRLLVTETNPDTPNTPNPSYRNMIRAGFVERFRYRNFAPTSQ